MNVRAKIEYDVSVEVMKCAKNGEISDRDVFEAAKDPKNPLHKEFIWDGDKAVETLGLIRAAELIKQAKEVWITVKDVPLVGPKYALVRTEPPTTKVFVEVEKIAADNKAAMKKMRGEIRNIINHLDGATKMALRLGLEEFFRAEIEEKVARKLDEYLG